MPNARFRASALSRSRDKSDPELVEAYQLTAIENVERHVAKVLAAAPPLTEEQRSRLASLLAGGGNNAA